MIDVSTRKLQASGHRTA